MLLTKELLTDLVTQMYNNKWRKPVVAIITSSGVQKESEKDRKEDRFVIYVNEREKTAKFVVLFPNGIIDIITSD